MREYEQPRRLEEVIPLLGKATENTYYLSGGTDLIVGLHEAHFSSYRIVDISHLEELKHIEEDEKHIYIGAAVTMTELSESPIIQKWMPALSYAASIMGSTLVRNKATVGGNIMNAAQCSDTLPVLYSYDATVHVLRSDGTMRTLPIRELVTGICKTTVDKDELVIKLEVRKRPNMSGFRKIGARQHVTISKLNGCILVEEEGQKVTVYLGAVGVKPTRGAIIEDCLREELAKAQKEGRSIALNDAIKEAGWQAIEAAIPTRSSKYYKRIAVYAFLDEALGQIARQMRGITHTGSAGGQDKDKEGP